MQNPTSPTYLANPMMPCRRGVTNILFFPDHLDLISDMLTLSM